MLTFNLGVELTVVLNSASLRRNLELGGHWDGLEENLDGGGVISFHEYAYNRYPRTDL